MGVYATDRIHWCYFRNPGHFGQAAWGRIYTKGKSEIDRKIGIFKSHFSNKIYFKAK